MASDLPPLPCTLVTGFLGAGKTTLLNHMLTQSAGRRIGCLVNEFGAIDIDSTLLASDTVAINSGVVELSNGCICCTINDSLRNAVAAMLQRRTDLDLLLIETTGIADPAPCLTTLWLPEFEGLLRVDGVVTVADATTIARSLASDPKIDAAAAPATDAKATSGGSSSSRIGSSGSSSSGGAASAAAEQKPVCFAQQLASADLLVLNKIDLLWERGAGAKLIQRLVDHLTTLAPRARVLTCQRGRVAIELLLSPSDAVAAARLADAKLPPATPSGLDVATSPAESQIGAASSQISAARSPAWARGGKHSGHLESDRFSSIAFSSDRPLRLGAFERLRHTAAWRCVVRAKGFLRFEESDGFLITYQQVGGRVEVLTSSLEPQAERGGGRAARLAEIESESSISPQSSSSPQKACTLVLIGQNLDREWLLRGLKACEAEEASPSEGDEGTGCAACDTVSYTHLTLPTKA